MRSRNAHYHQLLYTLVRFVGACAKRQDDWSTTEVGFPNREAQQVLRLSESECKRLSVLLARGTTITIDPESFAYVLHTLSSPLKPLGLAGQFWGQLYCHVVDAFIRFVWAEAEEHRVKCLFNMGLNQHHIKTLLGFDVTVFERTTSVAHHGLQVTMQDGLITEALQRVTEDRQDDDLATELVALGAPRAMIIALFGWSTQRYQLERVKLGRHDQGRPKAPSEAEEHAVWYAWQQQANVTIGERYRTVAKATGVNVGTIWRLTQDWAQ